MTDAPESYIFSQIPDSSAAEAFSFHQLVASSDPHIMPRSESQIKVFAERGELFGVRKATSGTFVAICYATLEERSHEWEIGGLTVLDELRKLGIGTVLVRFTLCSVIANERPWDFGDKIIAHVHEENPKPRGLLQAIGFELLAGKEGIVILPGESAPPSMKRNAEGNVVGHTFQFPRAAVRQLYNWLNGEWRGVLRDGNTQAIFQVHPNGPESIKEALKRELDSLD